MPSATIKQQMRSFLEENYMFGQAFSFQDSDSFLENGIIDSTGVLQMVTFLEETYGITVDEGELIPENLDSIDNIAAYLNRKRRGAEPEAGCSEPSEVVPGGNA